MFIKSKSVVQVLLCAALVAELGGCIFVEHDHDHWHHEPPPPAVVYVH